MIREKIKKDEVNKFYEVNYEDAINSEKLEIIIQNFRENIGFSSNQEFEDYLKNKDLNIDELKKKFVIEKLWNQLIFDKYKDLIKIDSDKINNKLEEIIKNNSEIISFNLSEIIFLEKNKDLIKKKYEEIIASIQTVGFKDAAVIHSMSESSKLGGDIGWINENQISKKIFLAIKDLKIGEFSDPIITAGGIILLNVNAKKNVDTEILSMIGVLEHLQHPREVLKQINLNNSIEYLYLSVPVFGLSVYLELLFPEMMHRQLSRDHTHLYTKESLEWTAKNLNMEVVSTWWFGQEMLDLYRFGSLVLSKESNISSKWQSIFLKIIDRLQLEIDKEYLSSEVHILFKKN